MAGGCGTRRRIAYCDGTGTGRRHHRYLDEDTDHGRQCGAGFESVQADRGGHGQFEEVGRADRNARTPCIPSAMISGVPASSQSTPARIAISAVARASSMDKTSSEI